MTEVLPGLNNIKSAEQVAHEGAKHIAATIIALCPDQKTKAKLSNRVTSKEYFIVHIFSEKPHKNRTHK